MEKGFLSTNKQYLIMSHIFLDFSDKVIEIKYNEKLKNLLGTINYPDKEVYKRNFLKEDFFGRL